MKSAVRDSGAHIGNYTSKSEASIQKVTALNVGETENYLTDRLEEQVRDEDFSIRKEQNCAKCWNEANLCFRTAVLIKVGRLVFYEMEVDVDLVKG